MLNGFLSIFSCGEGFSVFLEVLWSKLSTIAVCLLLPDLSVASIIFPLQSAGAKKDLTKELHACFYGNTAFPEPLKDWRLSLNIQQTQKSKVQ